MRRPALLAVSLLACSPLIVQGQAAVGDSARLLTIDRLFRRGEFAAQFAAPLQWMKDGQSFVTLHEGADGTAIVKVRVPQMDTAVLVPASALVDETGRRIAPEELTLSADEAKVLVFHSSVRVWRTNSRGRYHVVELATRKVTPLVANAIVRMRPMTDDLPPARNADGSPGFIARGLASGATDPDLQMYAKFSPDGRRVAFVRGNNLWVTDLDSGASRRLTTDGSDDIINGTTDWVHEEEFGLADAFRWSPDSRRLAFWRFDQSAVPAFPVTDELRRYPEVSVLRYPKAGAPNAAVRIGVVSADGDDARWLRVGADTGQYLPRMEWVDADSLSVLRLPRAQHRLDVLLVSATSGTGRTVLTDTDSAYVDVEGEPVRWIAGGRRVLLRSDRSGWRQWFLFDRTGRLIRQVTRDGADVTELAAIDETRGMLYALVASPSPREEQLFAFPLDGRRAPTRLTTTPGAHAVDVAPGARFAQHTRSTLSTAPVTAIVAFPSLAPVRTLVDNARLSARLAATALRPATFVSVPMPDGTVLDAYRIVPPDFDSTRAYPVLLHTYGGPAAPQVVDR
nr:DPP IV N-terminal domain-containing protein [Gemmatimonadaceae bacterium]